MGASRTTETLNELIALKDNRIRFSVISELSVSAVQSDGHERGPSDPSRWMLWRELKIRAAVDKLLLPL
jgi:hypothetical protein